jgi:hypothetical protein
VEWSLYHKQNASIYWSIQKGGEKMFSLRIETKVLMWPVFEKKKKPENVPES